MRLNEVIDPALMKLRLELKKLQFAGAERDKHIEELTGEVVRMKQTMVKLISHLGPQTANKSGRMRGRDDDSSKGSHVDIHV